MTRDPLEVEGLRANSGEGGEETAFARACEAADHNVGEALRNAGELRDDVAPVCTIAALELHRTPADFVQHLRERPTALAASPAVHQRAPLARQLRECGFEHRGDVARNDRGAELARSKRRACVQCPNPRSLGIIEHRMIRRQRDMILGELCGAADVDAVRIFGQCRHGDTAHARMQHALRAHRALLTLICPSWLPRASVSAQATRCRAVCLGPRRSDGRRRAGTSHCPHRSPRT